MRPNRKVSYGIIRGYLMTRGSKRFVLTTGVSALATVFVLVACSAPQNQNGSQTPINKPVLQTGKQSSKRSAKQAQCSQAMFTKSASRAAI